MEIKRRTDYAIRMMISVARYTGEKPLSISQISKEDEVPYQFARSIQHDLVQAGLLATIRGARGGNRLAKPAGQISLYDIVRAMQGPMTFSPCENDPAWCQRFGVCTVHGIWEELDADIRQRLKKVSLEQLVADQAKFNPAKVCR
ncbi:MAG: Rrf2 family transcriptional regulator [Actinomycetia bacterium]|nr:Rrf2 family transcriptional regulator [Actinomycetes bacterium]